MSVHHILDRLDNSTDRWKKLHIDACRSDNGYLAGELNDPWNIGPDVADNGNLKIGTNVDITTDTALVFDKATNTISSVAPWMISGASVVVDPLVTTTINGNPSLSINTTAAGADLDINVNDAFTLDASSISMDATAASNMTVTGASQDLNLNSIGGSVNISATEAATDAISIDAPNGSILLDSIRMAITCGTGSIAIDTNGVEISSTLATTDAIDINSSGGIDVDAVGIINLTSTNVSTDAITLNAPGITISPSASGVVTVTRPIDFTATTGGLNMNQVDGTVVLGAVTTNGRSGTITLSGTIAGLGTSSATVTNNQVTATSLIFLQVEALAGGQVACIASCTAGAGSYVFGVKNTNAAVTDVIPKVRYFIVN